MMQAMVAFVSAYVASEDVTAGLPDCFGFGDSQQFLGTSVHEPHIPVLVDHHDAILYHVPEWVGADLLQKDIQGIDSSGRLLTHSVSLTHWLALLGRAGWMMGPESD
jgi:hypothetical protein